MSRRTNLVAPIWRAARRKSGKYCGPLDRGSPITFFFVFTYTGRVEMCRCTTKSALRRRTAAICKLRVAFFRWPAFAVVLSPRPVWNGAGATASAASRMVWPATDSITFTCHFLCASVHSHVKKNATMISATRTRAAPPIPQDVEASNQSTRWSGVSGGGKSVAGKSGMPTAASIVATQKASSFFTPGPRNTCSFSRRRACRKAMKPATSQDRPAGS